MAETKLLSVRLPCKSVFGCGCMLFVAACLSIFQGCEGGILNKRDLWKAGWEEWRSGGKDRREGVEGLLMGVRANLNRDDSDSDGDQRAKQHLLTQSYNGGKMGEGVERGSGSALQLQRSWLQATDEGEGGKWQLLLFALVGGLGLSVLILVWLKNQMSQNSQSSSTEKEELVGGGGGGNGGGGSGDEGAGGGGGAGGSGGQWICHPVIRPMTTESLPSTSSTAVKRQLSIGCRGILPEVMTGRHAEGEPIRIRAKGLLERRGSSASLTIDLLHPSQENLTVTPTRECTAEEYLLSVGNVLSRKQLRACLKDVRSLHREFWDLPLNHPEKLTVPGSGSKNRYRTIIPNEATRVQLPDTSSSGTDSLTGYINANYIKGYDGEEKAFIATQGPLPHTVADLWQMVWQERAPVIVMFTRLWEKSRAKCEPYFPTELHSSATHSGITITVASINVKDGYTVRRFDLTKGEECRHTIHFWFDSWPDHKTPANAHSLLCLAKEVEIARFLPTLQRRLSTNASATPASASTPGPSHFLSPRSPDVSPSPPSLKEISPVLNFGRLEFKDDADTEADAVIAVEQEERTSPQPTPDDISSLITLMEKQTGSTKDDASDASPRAIEINQQRQFNSDEGDKVRPIKFGSLPHDNPKYADIDPENARSKSVENPPTWIEPSKDFNLSAVQKDTFENIPTDIFSFGNLDTFTSEPSPSPYEKQLSAKSNETTTATSRFRLPSASESVAGEVAAAVAGHRLSVDSPGYGGVGAADSSFGSPAFGEVAPWLRAWSPGPGPLPGSPRSPSWSGVQWGSDVPRGPAPAAGPVVVHCSAGIGRTGCFIAISIGINQLLGENNVDVLGIVCRMRYDSQEILHDKIGSGIPSCALTSPSKDFNLSAVQKDTFENIPTDIFSFGNLDTFTSEPSPSPYEKQLSAKSNETTTATSRFRLPSASESVAGEVAAAVAGHRLSVDSPGYGGVGAADSSFGSPAFGEVAPWLRAWSPGPGPLPGSPRSPSWSGVQWGSDVPRGPAPAAGPVVVHCSAGIGRTGCFIAISIGINQLLGENNVDVLGIVCRMRYDR
ncbi:uncharacterized protein LOC111061699 [Nilaparvata lugens]|uniref:uncharacterized protein LOC111061699 n=1 Tax=Nilaparvata lugens TaxID=108931 RepID=UPI00193CF66D|nr:uncharacterized protein LOC111061699 [Nilaparvata lugens]